jgi:hypothetical protein
MTTKVPFDMLTDVPDFALRSEIPDLLQQPLVRARSAATTVNASLSTSTVFTSYTAPTPANSAFDPSTGRFTPTVPGVYLIVGRVDFSAAQVTASRLLAEIRQGVDVRAATAIDASTTFPILEVSDLIRLNGTTDYVTLSARVTAAAAISNVYASFSAALVWSE